MSKEVSRETYPVFRDKYINKPVHKLESISRVDDVDRSGYVPLDLQYAQMMRTGASAEQLKDYVYNVDLQRLEEAMQSKKFDKELFKTTISKNLEKVDADYLFKEGLDKLDKARNWKKEYEKTFNEWQQLEREKAIRQEAVKAYKAQLESQSNS